MDNTKNKIGIIALISIILLFVIGGFFLMKYMVNRSENGKKDDKKNVKEVRIDTSKDYVYFSEEEEIIDDVLKQNVVLNFKGLEKINENLNDELINLSKDKKTTEGIDLPEDVVCENDLYSFKHRDYTYTKFGDYISLLIVDYNYDCINGSIPQNMKSYIIRKSSGEIINNEDLIKDFNVSEEAILNAVKKKINDTQTLIGDKEVIKIDDTISSFSSGAYDKNKALSVSKTGKLSINFIVKSSEINYNDSMEVN